MENVLFLGNGINRCFNGKSWEELITTIQKEHNPNIAYNDIKNLPMSMQVIAASQDHVDNAVKTLLPLLPVGVLSNDQIPILQQILSLPVEDIITTNYTFELEDAGEIGNTLGKIRRALRHSEPSKTSAEKDYLYRYFYVPDYEKRLWHIHGDISAPSKLVIGHFYYGRLTKTIGDYLSGFIRRNKYCENNGLPQECKSWVDAFLSKNIHILGFNMDFAEFDIWWMLCHKKRCFPQSKAFFYNKTSNLSIDKRLMLEAYGVTIIDITADQWIDFYNKALKAIKTNIQ